MNRTDLLRNLEAVPVWDLIIVGGGATGLGAAVEAASRGYKTLLLERDDFAKATSSRSTKLSHGGVRYLQQGNISLVFQALHERGIMIRNAPHLAHPLAFVIPAYRWWEKAFYGIGLTVYEFLAGRLSLGHSRVLSRKKTLEQLPTVKAEGLRGGVLYYDGQFDDARMAVTLARTAADLGATILNYVAVTGLVKEGGQVRGVTARDAETGRDYTLKARVVLNATGIFTDALRRLDDPAAKEILAVSQGTHIVLDKSFLPGTAALMVPKTEDGRVLFAVPWHGHVVVGTTDLHQPTPLAEPRALPEEVEFLLHHTAKYLSRPVGRGDVLSIFSGLRPLVQAGHAENTAKLSRDHTILVSPASLVTITGGKWTSYRHMAEDAVNRAAEVGGLPERPSTTRDLHLRGWEKPEAGKNGPDVNGYQNVYGADRPALLALAQADAALGAPLHPALPYLKAEVVWAARHEQARTLEDVLARRTRALLLNARASLEAAPEAARLLARELGRDAAWEQAQVAAYRALAEGYLLS